MTSATTTLARSCGATAPTDALFVVVSRLAAIIAIVRRARLLSPHFLTWSNFINVTAAGLAAVPDRGGPDARVLTGGIDLVGRAPSSGSPHALAASLISQRPSRSRASPPRWRSGSRAARRTACSSPTCRIPAFIATYGMLWIAHGLGYVFMKGEVIYGFPPEFRAIGAGFVGPIPVPVIVAVALLVLLHVMLHTTRPRPLRSTPSAAIRTRRGSPACRCAGA